jgi:hypothetical protein
LLGDVCEKLAPLQGTAEQWSAAVHRLYSSPLSDPSQARKSFDDYQELVLDHAALLCNLHSGLSADDALGKTLNSSAFQTANPVASRTVSILMPQDFEDCFPQPTDDEASIFHVAKTSRHATGLPTVSMSTRLGDLCSLLVHVIMIDGESMVSRVLDGLASVSRLHIDTVFAVASSLAQDCAPKNDGVRILLIRGLSNALTQAAKKSGYRSELPFMTDLVIAQLSLVHGLVVLQAVRRNGDREMILQQLAMACFHFQPLVRKITESEAHE